MITRIGVLYEDVTSLGFLDGLRQRLRCDAELVRPTGAIAKTPHLTRRTAKRAWEFFQARGVDLVVRFTDADKDPWQRKQQRETTLFPEGASGLVVCGVAARNVEDWLALDVGYLAKALRIEASELRDGPDRTGRIKHAINVATTSSGEEKSNLVSRIVAQAPGDVFCRWLQRDDSLRTFYQDCRSAAAKDKCETPNELESE